MGSENRMTEYFFSCRRVSALEEAIHHASLMVKETTESLAKHDHSSLCRHLFDESLTDQGVEEAWRALLGDSPSDLDLMFIYFGAKTWGANREVLRRIGLQAAEFIETRLILKGYQK